MDKTQSTVKINNEIKANRVLIINEAGERENEISFYEALNRATNSGLDLVQVGQNKGVVICRIFDYSKFQYQEKKKRDKQNAKNRSQELKSMSFRPGIGDNDFKIKVKKINEFLAEGHRVKISIRLKNREFTMKEMNEQFVNKLIKSFSEFGSKDGAISYTNKEISFLMRPTPSSVKKEVAVKEDEVAKEISE